MKITYQGTDKDNWLCTCGNTPDDYGFYACDEQGNYVEPETDQWSGIYYKCDRCGNVINQNTLEIK